MKHGLVFASFVLGAVLAGSIVLALQPAPDDRPQPAAPANAPPSQLQSAPAIAAERLRRWAADSLARPLFVPERRPAPPHSAVVVAEAPGVLPRLSGIMIMSSGRRAIFAGPPGGKPDVVSEGASVGRYQVQSIFAGGVMLVGPDGPHSLRPTFTGQAVADEPTP